MQKVVCDTKTSALTSIQGLLDKGWRVVPGTIVIASVERVRSEFDHGRGTPNGTMFDTMLSVTLTDASDEPYKPSGEHL